MAGRTPVPLTKPAPFKFGSAIQNPLTDVFGLTTPTGSSSAPATPLLNALNGGTVNPNATNPFSLTQTQPQGAGTPGKAASADGNAVPNTGNGTDASTGNTMSVDQEDMLRVGLDRDQEFYPNFLNDFHNVMYHIKFFMMDPDSYSTGLANIGNMEFSDVASTIDSANKVIIAETGVTAAINIKSMSFTGFASKKDEQTPVNFTMTLTEPLGTSFYDVTVNAAKTLGISSFQEVPYYIELTFRAYDENGVVVTSPLSGHQPMMDNGKPVPEDAMFHNGGRWLYQVFLVNVETEVDERGSVHTLTLNSAQNGYPGQDQKEIPEAIVVGGSTVGEFLKNLKEQLEAAQQRRYGVKVYTYDFQFQSSPFVKTDPSSWSLLDDPHIYTDKPNLDMRIVNGKPVMQIQPAEDIEDLLQKLFASTKEGQRYAINGTKAEDQLIDGGPQARDQIVMGISKNINVGKTHYVWGYEKHIVYQIRPHFHNHIILHPQQVEEAKQQNVQQQMVDKIKQAGLFRKRFDYYYTGMNTEVLRFDVKFNLAWSAVLPYVAGWQSDRNQVQVGAKYNENTVVTNNDLVQQLKQLNDAYTAAYSQLQTYVSSQFKNASALDVRADGTLTTGASVTSAQQNQLKTLAGTASAAQAKRDAFVKKNITAQTVEQDVSPVQLSGSGPLYAEDLTDNVDTFFHVPFVQTTAGKADSIGSGMSEPYHRDRAIFGILMEQLVGPKEMLTIDLDIRGDPYWLGTGNIENAPSPMQSPGVAPYDYGGVTFFLKVAYPFQASAMADNGLDEQATNPNFRQTTLGDGTQTREDAFTGFYLVTNIENKFEDGQFTQTLKAFRNPMIAANALGYKNLQSDQLGQWLSKYDTLEGSTSDIPPGGPTDISANEQAAACQLYSKLKGMGYNNYACAAIIGSFMQESSLNPAQHELDGGPGFGLAQWTTKERKNGLVAFARSRNLNINSADTQLAYMQYEMQTTYSGVGNKLKNAQNLNDAMSAMQGYEGFGIAGKRDQYAQQMLDKFNSGGCK